MAGQHAVVAQHLFHVQLVEPLHVGGQVFDLVVGGGGGGGGRSGGLGQASVHGDAAQGDQKSSVHRDGGGRSGASEQNERKESEKYVSTDERGETGLRLTAS